jgi:hypothetical protein
MSLLCVDIFVFVFFVFFCRYIPASSAPAMGLGNPGILELKMIKVGGSSAIAV